MRAGSRSGSWIPWIFVAGFAVVLAVNATMIWIGITSWPGLVTDNSYDRGLHYNRELEAAAAQTALGWQAEFSARLGEGLRGVLEASLRDRDGRPIEDASVEARFLRPTSEGHDFTLALAPEGGGRYTAAFELPLAGLWDVRLKVVRGGDRWVGQKRFFLH
jgi:nitrogen fixation protein FixH